MTLPTSFRYPNNITGKVDPAVEEMLQFHDDAIVDLQQAIPSLKSQIDAKTSTGGTTTSSTTTTNSETVIINQSSIGMVNNQTGNAVYTTAQADYGAFILFSDASAIAVSLAVGPVITLPWFATLINLGVGTVTITPNSGTINGGPTFTLTTNAAATIVFDGTNFEAFPAGLYPQNTPAVAHEWLASYNAATGLFTQTQPAVTDVTGAAPLASPTFTGTVTQPAPSVLTSATTTTSATSGSATALPATPAGYLEISINGTVFKVPYFAV